MNSESRIGILSLLVLLTIGSFDQLYSFDDKQTHRELTEKAIINSSIDKYFKVNMGLNNGSEMMFKGADRMGYDKKYSIIRWLQEGSEDEDNPLCRATNHFHNPIYAGDWTQSQMSDSIILVPTYSFLVDCGTKYSNVTWATGFTAPIAGYVGRERQEMGWDDARKSFFTALTVSDPATREAQFVKTFKSVGMVTHLLQDMAVPAHVRNDMRSHLINSTDTNKWGSNPFEKYVVVSVHAINIDFNSYNQISPYQSQFNEVTGYSRRIS